MPLILSFSFLCYFLMPWPWCGRFDWPSDLRHSGHDSERERASFCGHRQWDVAAVVGRSQFLDNGWIFEFRNTCFESLLCHFVWGAYRKWPSLLASLGTSFPFCTGGITVALLRWSWGLSEVTSIKLSLWWACIWYEFWKYFSPFLFSLLGSVGDGSDQLKSVDVCLMM